MLASAGPGEPTRLQRARSAVEQLRLAVPDVPAGISGLTDRALPYLFPTLDADVFSETLAQSVQVDSPPPLWTPSPRWPRASRRWERSRATASSGTESGTAPACSSPTVRRGRRSVTRPGGETALPARRAPGGRPRRPDLHPGRQPRGVLPSRGVRHCLDRARGADHGRCRVRRERPRRRRDCAADGRRPGTTSPGRVAQTSRPLAPWLAGLALCSSSPSLRSERFASPPSFAADGSAAPPFPARGSGEEGRLIRCS